MRGRIAARYANVPRCLIGIEAGMATHYVARELIALGHDVRQVPPAYANRSGKATRTTSETPTREREHPGAPSLCWSVRKRRIELNTVATQVVEGTALKVAEFPTKI